MITLSVTAYNEKSRGNFHWIREAIHPAICHPAVEEIVVVDDASPDAAELCEALEGIPKVRLYVNPENIGVFANKIEAVARATSDWVLNLDSDNRCDAAYISRAAGLEKEADVWYCPSFARPAFNYRGLAGTYDLKGIGKLFGKPMFDCFVNTGNSLVHRVTYLDVFGKYRGRRFDLDMPNLFNLPEETRQTQYWRLVWDACDSFILNFEWLKAGKRLCVVPGMEYDHRIDTGQLSNFVRSPDEKSLLGKMLMKQLRGMTECQA